MIKGIIEGLKFICGNPEMRKTAIKGVAAVAASGVAGYAVGRTLSGKNKHYEGEFPAGTELTILDGNVYHKYPDGRLIPYLLKDDEDYDECDAYEEQKTNRRRKQSAKRNSNRRGGVRNGIVYIKGQPFRMDRYGNYTPVRLIESKSNNKRSRYER